MKTLRHTRVLIAAFAAAILLSVLPSCHDDLVITDFYPIEANFWIRDASGNNLLDPSVPGNLVGKRIFAEYEGHEYELEWDKPESRAIPADFTGLTLNHAGMMTDEGYRPDPGRPFLSFGEFDGNDNLDISLTLHIEGYSETWKFEMTRRVTWKKQRAIVADAIYLNGAEVSSCHDLNITL